MTFVEEAMAMLGDVEDSGIQEILERDILMAEEIEESGDDVSAAFIRKSKRKNSDRKGPDF